MAESSTHTVTVIGTDTHIKGELSFESQARILGTCEGRISARGEVQIGPQGLCKATVEASSVLVEGTVEGDLIARDLVQLNPTARVTGTISAGTLMVAEGATFIGNCRIGPGAAAATERAPAAVEAKPAKQAQPAAPAVNDADLDEIRTRMTGMTAKPAWANGTAR